MVRINFIIIIRTGHNRLLPGGLEFLISYIRLITESQLFIPFLELRIGVLSVLKKFTIITLTRHNRLLPGALVMMVLVSVSATAGAFLGDVCGEGEAAAGENIKTLISKSYFFNDFKKLFF